jgi:DNA-binding YbaB/EbfC family protein
MNPLKMLGALGNIGKIQEEIQAAQAEFATMEFVGKAGGGLVTATVNGAQQMKSCVIDPKLIADNDRELLEDLIVAAVNDAAARARKECTELLHQRLASKLNLPDLPDIISGFLPKV